ncbi:MAG: aminotransferase class V-fold PLP-dependent enzyme [Clostridia bacterium]|nr:aminotransferase class V-fold PLP-dependent enzyme [Clostridia bacterium]
MNTPICDFVRKYNDNGALRLHMPGHKGEGALGIEALDITEIDGADSLYQASGIIKQSEENASLLFGAKTFYSTEGSSHCIRAMLYLCSLLGDGRPLIFAGRNAHKAFLTAAALMDFDVKWLYPNENETYLSCKIDPKALDIALSSADRLPSAVYLTSPDYLGNTQDIKAIAEVCHKHGVLLAVDNAHGAYLKFLPKSCHPIDLGADICCDSAHKTLPVLTGGAYLHISPTAPDFFAENAKKSLSIFGSTSPSYLILQSLDATNAYIASGLSQKLAEFTIKVSQCKKRLAENGYCFIGDEPMKLTLATKKYGYTGYALKDILRENGIYVEFSDPDYLVMMLTVDTDIERLERVLLSIPKLNEILVSPPRFSTPRQVLSVRDACFAKSELIPIKNANGRTLAEVSVGCPPAVPIAACGERLTKEIIKCFEYYGITECSVVVE